MENLLILCAIILAIYFYRKNKKEKAAKQKLQKNPIPKYPPVPPVPPKPPTPIIPLDDVSFDYEPSISNIGEYLVIDTETDGLRELTREPNILRIAWMLFDKDLKLVSKQLYVHRCEGVTDHGLKFISMSREELESGISMEEILEKLSIDLANAQFTVAHNVDFHLDLIRLEYKNRGQKVPKALFKKNGYCTVLNNREIFGKYAKLKDICEYYLGFIIRVTSILRKKL